MIQFDGPYHVPVSENRAVTRGYDKEKVLQFCLQNHKLAQVPQRSPHATTDVQNHRRNRLVSGRIGIIGKVSLVCFFGSLLWLNLMPSSALAQQTATEATEPSEVSEPEVLNKEESIYLRRDLSALKAILNENVPVWTPQTLGLTADDGPFLYEALARLQDLEPHALSTRRAKFLSERTGQFGEKQPFSVFVDLFHHPELYQGEPILMQGHSQRIVAIPGAEFIPNCEQLYEVWIYPEDGLTNPAVLITTSLPQGVEVGDQIINGLSAEGVFLKRYTYRAADAMRFAPLIVTTQLKRQTASEGASADSAFQLLLGIAIVAVAGIGMGVVMTKWSKKKKRVRSTSQTLEFPTEPME